MNAIEVSRVSYHYGRVDALRDVSFTVREGALYALLGPNGAGKTTLLQVIMGLRRADSGHATVLGTDSARFGHRERRRIAYVADGQVLPGWMRLRELEAYLAPLYDTWDHQLAGNLRERFDLDPARKISKLSRGERMKAALLCALAPRPSVIIMDEPFNGMDVMVKDELVRGLLASSGAEGCTILISSHDLGELELLADWVGFLDRGAVRLSEPMDRVREQFTRVEVTVPDARAVANACALPPDWMSAEASGNRLTFVLRAESRQEAERLIRSRLGERAQIDARDASLREIFVALASARVAQRQTGAAA